MSDIFISYASADRDRARVIAEALAARGWSVWWDRVIPPGRQFDEVIEEALDASRCVVVLWSKTSTGSSWVKTEAAEAMSRKALIPAIIEDVKIPLEFRRLQAADLSQWAGDPNDPQLQQFFRSIEAELSRRPAGAGEMSGSSDRAAEPLRRVEPAPPPTPPLSAPAGARKRSPALVGGVVAALAALLLGGYYYQSSRSAALAEQESKRRAEDERRANAASANPQPAAAGAPGVPAAPPASSVAQQNRAPKAVPASGAAHVQWRDHALGYSGMLAWNPSSAMLEVSVVDLQTGTAVGDYSVPAAVQQVAATDYVVSAQFAVPGDSATPGPHTHTSRLLFKAQQDGSLRLVQNCPRPGECY